MDVQKLLRRQTTRFAKDGKPRPRLTMRRQMTRFDSGEQSFLPRQGQDLVEKLKKEIDDLKRENAYLRGASESAVTDVSDSRAIPDRNIESFEITGQGVIGFLLVRDPSVKSYSLHLRGEKNLVLGIYDKHVEFENKKYEMSEDTNAHLVNFFAEEQWIWISIDHFNQIINIGTGFINLASVVLTINLDEFDERLHTVKEIAVNSVIPLKTRKKWMPVVHDYAPAIVGKDQVNLWDIYNNTAVTIDTLPQECRELYSMVAGEGISLKEIDVQAIEYSLATPGCRLYEICAEKKREDEFHDESKIYVRCTMGEFEGNSPGSPFVLELWPNQSCSSPVHNHSDACAVIKVLHGEIDVSWFDPIVPHGKKNDVTGTTLPRQIGYQRFSKDQVTWLTEDMYGCHRLENCHKSKTCITLQCYQYHSSDKAHYEFFDFIVDGEEGLTTQQFHPNSDIDFGDLMKTVHAEYAQSQSGHWCEDDKFILTDDNAMLTALCKQHKIEYPGTGLPGVIRKIVGPIAHVSYMHGPDQGVEKVPVKALQYVKAFGSPQPKEVSDSKFGTPQLQSRASIELPQKLNTSEMSGETKAKLSQVTSQWQQTNQELKQIVE